MNNSVAVTGGVSTSAATLVPVIHWLFPTIPAEVLVAFAAGIVTLAHAGHQLAVMKGWYPNEDAPKNDLAAQDAAPVLDQQYPSTN